MLFHPLRARNAIAAQTACLALLLAATSGLRAQTPMPAFTGERVYAAGVPDIYGPLREHIAQLEESSQQTYYVVVVQSSGNGNYATRDYVDALYQKWVEQAARGQQSLDPNRSVIVVLALGNRQLAVHPGTLLQSRFGLQGQAIDRQLVQPHFIPHARAGNYAEGLRVLLSEIEQWITRKETAEQREQEAARERAAEVKRHADTTLSSARQLLDTARTELKAKQEAGLDVREQSAAVTQAAATLDSLAGLTNQPQTVLESATKVRATLQGALDELRRLSALQTEADAVLDRAEAQALKIEKSLEEHRRASRATLDLEKRLEAARQSAAQARNRLASVPRHALAGAQQATSDLNEIEGQMRLLPQLERQYTAGKVDAGAALEGLAEELKQADEAGVDVNAAGQEYRQFEQALAAADATEMGYQRAIASLESLEAEARSQQQQVASLRERHVFLTRTLPVSAAALLLLASIAAVAALWYRRRQLRILAVERLEAFKRHTVQLLERLDALKKQHEYLPFTDPDFSEPMAGATLSAYNEVDAMHGGLRERWLSMMDLRQRAERLLATEKFYRARQFQEIVRLLGDKAQSAEVEPIYQQCAEHLDRLAQAHERAEEALADSEQSVGHIEKLLEQVTAAQLATQPYTGGLQAATAQIEAARKSLASDPLGARSLLEQIQAQLSQLARVVERVVQLVQAAAEIDSGIRQTEQRAVEKRGEGLMLLEEGGNPDAWLEQAATERRTVLAALNEAEIAAAEQHLEQAREAATQAAQAIDRHLEARSCCQQQVPALRQESQRLAGQAVRAQGELAELKRDFAAESWQAVADNLTEAAGLQSSFDAAIERADTESGEAEQRYLAAAQRLEQAAAEQQQADALIAAVGGRLGELIATRARCRTRLKEIVSQAAQVQELIDQRHDIVGADSRTALAAAQQELQAVERSMQESAANWPRLERELEQAQHNVSMAQELAENDVQAHRQFLAELDAARNLQRDVDRLLKGATTDRVQANQRYRAAAQELEQIAQDIAASVDWEALTERTRHVVEDLEQARTWAHDDIRLAEQAARAIFEAEKHYQRARTYLSIGISPNLSAAESRLAEARSQFKSQNYEGSIQQADEAERAARAAYDEAQRAERIRRQREERERRRRSVLSGPGFPTVVVGGPFGGGSIFGSSGRRSSGGFGGFGSSGSSSSSWSGRSGSSSSSWSSGSSQSSW